jgi:1A family penicillin-binding protein
MLSRFEYDRMLKRYSHPANRIKLISYIALGAFVLFLVGILVVAILFALVAKDLPRPDKVQRVDGLSTVILDRNGETIYDIFKNQNRIPVLQEDIPKALKEATVAVEDKEFFTHQGLSTKGITRAVINVVVFHKSLQSGSTLTQQLVKNALLTNEQTMSRKIKEAILSIQIERKYTKDEILQMYLNEAPYGGTAVGVEAASKYYFNKHTKELTVAECVVLSGLPQSPTYYSPFGADPKAYVPRAYHVLTRMREDGYITSQQEIALRKEVDTMKFPGGGDDSLKAPHFVAYVKEQLNERFGADVLEKGGYRIKTTLDLKLQETAQKIVKEEIDKVKNLKVSNGAAVVIDPKTGEILAMVGSKDYAATDSGGLKFNVATQGLRQPGSTMKPFSYAAAMIKGYTPATLLMDVDTKYPSGEKDKPEYNPKNYDLKYRGPMQLRYALANSINTIAVKVTALTGVKDVLRTAYEMGLTTLEPTDDNMKRFGLSLTLGGGEVRLLDLTSAFGGFATGGYRSEPVSILSVIDAKGKTAYEYKPNEPKRVLPADIAFLISSILSDNDARKDTFGVASKLVIPGHTVAVKTGTTDDKRDNWTVGYTPSTVVGVWVGNNDNSVMDPRLASGVTGAAPIWNRIMMEVLKNTKKDEPFTKPDSIVEVEIDTLGGGLPKDGQGKRKEFFVKGTEPTTTSPVYSQVKVSRKDSSKRANAVEVLRGEYDLKDGIVFNESDPVSTDGKNRWQEGIDAWMQTQSDSRYKLYKETYQGTDSMAVVIRDPQDKSEVRGSTINVTADAISTTDITRMEIYIDNDKKKEGSGNHISEQIGNLSDGIRTIRVRALDKDGKSTDTIIQVGFNQSYANPTPVPAPTSTP